jgi:hypothetical protein
VYRGSLTRQIYASNGLIAASMAMGDASVSGNGGDSSSALQLQASVWQYVCTEKNLTFDGDFVGGNTIATFLRA